MLNIKKMSLHLRTINLIVKIMHVVEVIVYGLVMAPILYGIYKIILEIIKGVRKKMDEKNNGK